MFSDSTHLSILINDGNELRISCVGVEQGVLGSAVRGVGMRHRAAHTAECAAKAGICTRSSYAQVTTFAVSVTGQDLGSRSAY